MTEQAFLTKLQDDILGTDEDLTMDTVLMDIEEWDSLSYVSFVAFAEMSGASVDRNAVREAKTVGDLYALLKK